MTESAKDLKSVAAAPVAVASHAQCRQCGYDLHGLPADGRCPECGSVVAESLREELLDFADPRWLANLLRGVRMLVIGCGLAVAIVIFLLLFGDRLPSNSSTGPICCAIGFIICWCVIGAWLLSKPDPSGLGEREYGVFRKIARCAAVLGAIQGLLDVGAIYWANSAPSFSEHVLTETALAQIIGVVGVFAQLQYFQMLSERTIDRVMPPFAKFLKIALTLSWGILYALTLVAFMEFHFHLDFLDQTFRAIAVIDVLVGGFFLLFYPFFLFGLGATLAGALREARKAKP
jgi:hypothetical protein